jgi:cytidyltransferase-like protein
MRKVMCAGVFDYFHPGHKFFLESAKKFGDHLIVIIARDKNVQRIKKLSPHHNEKERQKTVQESGIANEVILGSENDDFLKVIHEKEPDILVIGYDQNTPHDFQKHFPTLQIRRIPPKKPHKWKSSQYRKLYPPPMPNEKCCHK